MSHRRNTIISTRHGSTHDCLKTLHHLLHSEDSGIQGRITEDGQFVLRGQGHFARSLFCYRGMILEEDGCVQLHGHITMVWWMVLLRANVIALLLLYIQSVGTHLVLAFTLHATAIAGAFALMEGALYRYDGLYLWLVQQMERVSTDTPPDIRRTDR